MKLNDFWQLRRSECRQTLRDISADTSVEDGSPVYMTDNRTPVISFDLVKRKYMNDLGMSEEGASSADALFQATSEKDPEDDGIYLVEFKNGAIENRSIERKARDSVLIFQSITGTQLEYTRKHVRFVLVYNEENHPLSVRDEKALALARRGKTDYSCFGLAHLRGFCFKEVHTWDRKRFDSVMGARLSGSV